MGEHLIEIGRKIIISVSRGLLKSAAELDESYVNTKVPACTKSCITQSMMLSTASSKLAGGFQTRAVLAHNRQPQLANWAWLTAG